MNTPDHRKSTQLCHINMIKLYFLLTNDNPALVIHESESVKDKENIALKNKHHVKINNF